MELTPGFSLDTEVLRYEGNLIRRALEESGGSVTRAARLLGVTHQGLSFYSERTPQRSFVDSHSGKTPASKYHSSPLERRSTMGQLLWRCFS